MRNEPADQLMAVLPVQGLESIPDLTCELGQSIDDGGSLERPRDSRF
jgi:hypothetical protein